MPILSKFIEQTTLNFKGVTTRSFKPGRRLKKSQMMRRVYMFFELTPKKKRQTSRASKSNKSVEDLIREEQALLDIAQDAFHKKLYMLMFSFLYYLGFWLFYKYMHETKTDDSYDA
ncbi:uncharacterized protein LOC126748879 [Anthonomus grandis grandis]|uniref:uncharacterized protein LOC126748879 n=1 Tax=Anthonomus grandis grandis TaxID=2921223 RepID=UPI0021654E13|nr:uncharacterized protein LOC126748879 [Anthonomus grandis grandis]